MLQSTQETLLPLQLSPAATHLAVNHFTKGQRAGPVGTLIPDAAGTTLSIPAHSGTSHQHTQHNTSSVLR